RNGIWGWPNGQSKDVWRWRNNGNSIWFRPSNIFVGNLTIARSGSNSGNVAVASNPVFISHGLWRWPGQIRDDSWFWQNRDRDGILFRTNLTSVGNITSAGS